MNKHFNISISGHVQGVGFRFFAYNKAKLIGNLCGYVSNMYDGSLFIDVEGPEAQINAFISMLKEGPSRAYIEHFIIEEFPYKGQFNSFTIK